MTITITEKYANDDTGTYIEIYCTKCHQEFSTCSKYNPNGKIQDGLATDRNALIEKHNLQCNEFH